MAKILQVSFYNQKSLGLRYVENALTAHGHSVKTVYFKKFNSQNPSEVTTAELEILGRVVEEYKPNLIGLSVMVSLNLEQVFLVNDYLKNKFAIPIVWGGVYATMFPEKCMEKADFVIRGEGEEPSVELVEFLSMYSVSFPNTIGSGETRDENPDRQQTPPSDLAYSLSEEGSATNPPKNKAVNEFNDLSSIKNLVYRKNGEVVINEMRDFLTELDKYGVPNIGGDKCLIENNALTQGDPQIRSLSYELTASRGCPFACSYCCSINLMRLGRGRGKYVRFREVGHVMEELLNAKAKVKNLKVIHFWDEIFNDKDDWIDEFSSRYKKEINLPFEIWGHPLKCGDELIRKLKKAGLYKVVMGIQSGSPYIRKEIFNRPETQEDIVKASVVLARHKVPQVVYDLMLRHPFETVETIKETFELTARLVPPFQLQLHGLNFFPGTDIVQTAIDRGLVSAEEMERRMNTTLKEQYKMHWEHEGANEEINYWYNLTELLQFPLLRGKAKRLAKSEPTHANFEKAKKLCRLGKKLEKIRYYYDKGLIVAKGTFKL